MLSVFNRFVSPDIKKKYDLELPEYEGIGELMIGTQ